MNPQNVQCVVSQLRNGVQDARLSGTAEGMNRLNAISLPFTCYLNYKFKGEIRRLLLNILVNDYIETPIIVQKIGRAN